MRARRRILVALASLVAVVSVTGCSGGGADASGPASDIGASSHAPSSQMSPDEPGAAGAYRFTRSARGDRSGRYPGWKEVDLSLHGYEPNSRVRCRASGQGAPDWTSTFKVDDHGEWGKEWTGSGTGPAAIVGRGTHMNNFGTCRQL